MGEAFIGTSGWQYAHWQGQFYPRGLPQKDWLNFYAQDFSAVEVNATFYQQMRPETFKNWRKIVGPDFTFTIKANRFITHIKRLKDCQEEVDRLAESIVSLLGEKIDECAGRHKIFEERNPPAGGSCSAGFVPQKILVPTSAHLQKPKISKTGIHQSLFFKAYRDVILWQLPPRMKADPKRLSEFLKLLPKIFRHAFEFRDGSWLVPEIYSLLKANNCGLVIQDSPQWPKSEVVTADFVYLRFHGSKFLYASCYSQEELKAWASKIQKWLGENLDVYAFFNNDAEGFAVQNARQLQALIRTGQR
jgi:uncharacterized protein YecE (DUF72 family)